MNNFASLFCSFIKFRKLLTLQVASKGCTTLLNKQIKIKEHIR